MTTDGVPRPHDWKLLYQLAVVELDPTKLPQRISDAVSQSWTALTRIMRSPMTTMSIWN
jgi:hypothetical protein